MKLDSWTYLFDRGSGRYVHVFVGVQQVVRDLVAMDLSPQSSSSHPTCSLLHAPLLESAMQLSLIHTCASVRKSHHWEIISCYKHPNSDILPTWTSYIRKPKPHIHQGPFAPKDTDNDSKVNPQYLNSLLFVFKIGHVSNWSKTSSIQQPCVYQFRWNESGCRVLLAAECLLYQVVHRSTCWQCVSKTIDNVWMNDWLTNQSSKQVQIQSSTRTYPGRLARPRWVLPALHIYNQANEAQSDPILFHSILFRPIFYSKPSQRH